jgi:hypothetical protein
VVFASLYSTKSTIALILSYNGVVVQTWGSQFHFISNSVQKREVKLVEKNYKL